MMARAHSLSTHAVHTAPPLPPPHQFPNDNVDYDGIDDGGEDDHDGDEEDAPSHAVHHHHSDPLTPALLLHCHQVELPPSWIATKLNCRQVELPPSDKSCLELEGFKRDPRPRLDFQINTTQDFLSYTSHNTYKAYI